MSEKTRCAERIAVRGMVGRCCTHPGKLEHGGKLYCAQHHPPTMWARYKTKREERAAQLRKEADACLAAAERKRRQRMAYGLVYETMKDLDPAWHAALETWIANGGEMPRRGA